MVAVRNCLMPTRRTVGMRAVHFWRAAFRIGGADRNDVLVNVALVNVVEMPIVQVVDVPLVVYGRMPAIGAVSMRVVRMMSFVAGRHRSFSFLEGGG